VTDCDRLLAALKAAGPRGLHSHDIRRQGLSGNPSQRVTELQARGFAVSSTRENRGKRPGARYIYNGTAGVDAGKCSVSGPGHSGSSLTGVLADTASVDSGGPRPGGAGVVGVGSERRAGHVARVGDERAPGLCGRASQPQSPAVDPGESPETTDQSASSLAGSSLAPVSGDAARLFALPPENALTRRPEAA
jgi:hypothetical protein